MPGMPNACAPSCTKVRLPAAQHWPMLNCSAMNASSAACQ